MMQLKVRASDISRSREIHKNTQNNSVEILSNTCLYNIFETYLNHWGYLLAVNVKIYLETLSLVKSTRNIPKLPGIDYVVKNWALAMMFKALSLVHFWNVLLLKEQNLMMTSFRKTLKMLVWSGQNRSICDEIFPENNHKIGLFYRLIFCKVCPENCCEIRQFIREFAPKNPVKLDFFSATCQKFCTVWRNPSDPSDLKIPWIEVGINLEVN